MHFRHATGVFLILIGSVIPALGQGRPAPNRATYGIAGTVRDDYDQRAMENIRVDLKQSTGTPINTTFTRGNGEFEFAGLPNGDYTIEIVMKDYEPYRETITIENSVRRGLTVFLRRPMVVPTANANVTISAHELSVPHKAHDEYEKGLNLVYAKSDYKGAIVQFERAIKDFPNFYEAFAQEGSAYVFLGQTGPAEEAMRKSIELSSGQYSEALFLLAGLLNNTKRFPEAEALSRQGVALDAASWHGHFEMARALLALKRTEEAEKSAIEARDLKRDNPAVYLVLANIHIQKRDYAALLKDLDSYLKLAPTGPEAEQARKTRDDVKAAMRTAQDQTGANEQDQSRSKAQDQSGSKATEKPRSGKQTQPGTGTQGQPKSDEHEQSQSNDDPPLLPHLPPPQPEP
jgi:tetratricopeptide (TPR) repeat protein